jgi:hypothetical protein
MTAGGKELYWGDNGVHEFWESEDTELLILRNHGESSWTVHRHHGFLFGCLSANEAATRLNVVLSPARKWTRQGRERFFLDVAAEGQETT